MNLRELREAVYQHNVELDNAAHSSLRDAKVTAGKHSWKVTAVVHAKSQATIRHPSKDTTGWQDFHRKAIAGLESSLPKNNGTHVILSKSHNHGVVAHIDHKARTMRIITVLDHNQTKPSSPTDTKLQVESTVNIE